VEGKLKETGRKAGRAKDNIRMRKMIVKRRGEAKGGQGKKSERRRNYHENNFVNFLCNT